MAETAAKPRRRGPSTALLTGCGVGCGVVLVVLLGLLVVATRKGGALLETGRQFVTAAAGGDLAQAYDQLHGSRQQVLPRATFDQHWSAVRRRLGELRSVEPTGAGQANFQTGTFAQTYRLTGAADQATCTVMLNPNDQPVKVLDYQIADAENPNNPGT